MAKNESVNKDLQAKKKAREKRAQARFGSDVKEITALPAGRRFVYWLIYEKCGIKDVYLGQDSGIYKHEGRRGVGAEIDEYLMTEHPQAYIEMMSERIARVRQDSEAREAEAREAEETGDDQ